MSLGGGRGGGGDGGGTAGGGGVGGGCGEAAFLLRGMDGFVGFLVKLG